MRLGGPELLIVLGILLLILLPLYALPSIIGGVRRVSNLGRLVAVNVLLGWTVIGWIVALVWALAPPENGT